MGNSHHRHRPLPENPSVLLDRVRAEPLSKRKHIKRGLRERDKHHCLKGLKTVGERLFYAIVDEDGEWLGVAVFMAASRRLRHRGRWIGWDDEQRRRRLPLVVNNARFLLLPNKTVPNLGSVALKLLCDRLGDDWMAHYGHPVAVAETFVDPAHFGGTVYTAAGWKELGSLKERFQREVPDYHVKRCLYPVHALPTIMAAAHLSDSPRGSWPERSTSTASSSASTRSTRRRKPRT